MDTFDSCHAALAIGNAGRTLKVAKNDDYNSRFGFGRVPARSGEGGRVSWQIKVMMLGSSQAPTRISHQ